MTTPALDLFLQKDEVRDVIMRFSHGVDRKDWDMVRGCYHPDGYDDHGPYSGGVDGMLTWMNNRHQTVETSMHLIGNILIDFQDDVAYVESYFIAYQRLAGDSEMSFAMFGDAKGGDGSQNMQIFGRYVDRFERRKVGGPWLIAHRIVTVDSARLEDTTLNVSLDEGWIVSHRTNEDSWYTIRNLAVSA
jgi:hypothetical protein